MDNWKDFIRKEDIRKPEKRWHDDNADFDDNLLPYIRGLSRILKGYDKQITDIESLSKFNSFCESLINQISLTQKDANR